MGKKWRSVLSVAGDRITLCPGFFSAHADSFFITHIPAPSKQHATYAERAGRHEYRASDLELLLPDHRGVALGSGTRADKHILGGGQKREPDDDHQDRY